MPEVSEAEYAELRKAKEELASAIPKITELTSTVSAFEKANKTATSQVEELNGRLSVYVKKEQTETIYQDIADHVKGTIQEARSKGDTSISDLDPDFLAMQQTQINEIDFSKRGTEEYKSMLNKICGSAYAVQEKILGKFNSQREQTQFSKNGGATQPINNNSTLEDQFNKISSSFASKLGASK